MNRLLLTVIPLFLFSTNSIGQTLDSERVQMKDTAFFKKRGVYVIFGPWSGKSINTDNTIEFNHLGVRLSANWITKKGRKFAWLGSIASGSGNGSKSMNFYETGFLIGKLLQSNRKRFFDVNVGLAAVGRKAKSPMWNFGWGPYPPKEEEVREVHTVGIPFDLSINTARGALGLGTGVSGNLNVNQPYAALMIRLRFGNPVSKKYSKLFGKSIPK